MPKWPDDFSPVGPDGCTPSKRRKAEFDAYREGYQDGFNKGLAAPRPAVATAGDGEWRRHVAAAWAAIDPEMTEREAKARTHLDAALASRPVEAAQGGVPSFQARVSTWMEQCFLPSLYSNMTERGDRLLEEVLELLQSKGYDPTRVGTLVNYVWNRPMGEPSQEVGGVMVTLAGYCWIAGLDMHECGDTELARINRPEVMAKIRAKQEAKNALHFDTPLPGLAAAPEVDRAG